MSELKVPKLKGSANYDVWEIQISALLTEKGLVPMTDDAEERRIWYQSNVDKSYRALAIIRLHLENGPLINTKHCLSSEALIHCLQTLYKPKGFSSDFILCKELFTTTLARARTVENYLSRIRRLVEDLQARDLTIPNKVIAAYILSNLTNEYDHVVSVISQSYRSETDVDLDILFSQIMDESRRLKYRDDDIEMSMTATMTQRDKSQAQKGNKSTKKGNFRPQNRQKCPHCNKTGHEPTKCWIKYPHLHPTEASTNLVDGTDQSEIALTIHDTTIRQQAEEYANLATSYTNTA